MAAPRVQRKSLVCRADGGFIGSSTNLVRFRWRLDAGAV
jgi:hypothetical protein